MNENEFLALMQSDSKLWDYATTTHNKDGSIDKTLQIPWGIGEITVTLEGMDNVQGRRAAFNSFGDYIRGLINDKTSDDAITARAKQAAARVGEKSDSLIDSTGTRPEEPETIFDSETVETYDDPTLQIADPAARLTNLRRAIDRARKFIDSTETEMKALEAYMEIINASEHKKTPLSDSQAASDWESEGGSVKSSDDATDESQT